MHPAGQSARGPCWPGKGVAFLGLDEYAKRNYRSNMTDVLWEVCSKVK